MTRRSAALHLMASAAGVLAHVDLATVKAAKPVKAKPSSRILRRAETLIAQEHDAAVKLYREASGQGKKQVAPGLDSLQQDLADALGALTGRLAAGDITNADWESEFEVLLARYHTAGLMLGQKTEDVGPAAAEYLIRFVGGQFEFLGNFTVEIQDAAEWQDGFRARAESYAGAIGAPYWSGETQFLPLPAMPRDGTSQCLSNCGCEWRVETLDDAAGDYDCYWVRSKDDSCGICIQREADWNPLQIRGGELQ